jgi:hypothetical protein
MLRHCRGSRNVRVLVERVRESLGPHRRPPRRAHHQPSDLAACAAACDESGKPIERARESLGPHRRPRRSAPRQPSDIAAYRQPAVSPTSPSTFDLFRRARMLVEADWISDGLNLAASQI